MRSALHNLPNVGAQVNGRLWGPPFGNWHQCGAAGASRSPRLSDRRGSRRFALLTARMAVGVPPASLSPGDCFRAGPSGVDFGRPAEVGASAPRRLQPRLAGGGISEDPPELRTEDAAVNPAPFCRETDGGQGGGGVGAYAGWACARTRTAHREGCATRPRTTVSRPGSARMSSSAKGRANQALSPYASSSSR